MVDLIRLMENLSAADQVIMYDERGSDVPLSDEELDAILKALADTAARQS